MFVIYDSNNPLFIFTCGASNDLRPLFFAAGYMLIGSDVKLNSPMSLVGQALAEILQYPERARDALRVLLHLVR